MTSKGNLIDLPPELLDHIVEYLPTANAVANLGASSKSLRRAVDTDGWTTFNRTRFPSLHPANTLSQSHTARTLTTLSKAWDRRAFLTTYIEPRDNITVYPGGKKVDKWKRPKGQTIGFTPQLDVYEEVGQTWQEREEVLAFSAGAEVCVRRKRRRGSEETSAWATYRPLSAYEGRDDVTTLHLLRSKAQQESKVQRLVGGTANGDLWVLSIPEDDSEDVPTSYLVTNGQPVRSSSLLHRPTENQDLLVANMGDSRVSIYSIDPSAGKIAPSDSLDIRPPQTNGGHVKNQQRVWSSEFLSPNRIATGIGPSSEPLHIYEILPTGFSKEPVRKFSLQNELFEPSDEDTVAPAGKKRSSSIYPIAPLPPYNTAGGSANGNVFLSGAYDGAVRLHDMRSRRDVEMIYSDLTDESAVYSLLPRGQETLVVGGSRHSLLKFFDLRLGSKCYDYSHAAAHSTSGELVQGTSMGAPNGYSADHISNDWNLFLRPSNASSGPGARGNWASRRSLESSVYSLASASSTSPFLYAGVENAVLELGFTGVLDANPDPAFFNRRTPASKRDEETLSLAMYEQDSQMKLCTQRTVGETLAANQQGSEVAYIHGLDERWRVGSGDDGRTWARSERGT
ncbi:hypothetical protein KC363_g7885 [Hortaea werneckii]|uniref:F-box domain-containing protein n=1 Tax=Hortaea werneckii TaxID=91943 RepID=A0A3M7FNR4_HORWE|nr:hypothetical protein KC363_g7885 [Hortaea werneckii]RMY90530.1 hypothetical protein D0861_03595 [Hortaea werneckii]